MIPEDLTVLLIEDNPGDARLLSEYFRESGRDVTLVEGEEDPATDGIVINHFTRVETGVEGLDTVDADVILLDLNLPDKDGMETVEAVRSATDRTPIVVLTGIPESQLGVDAVTRGAQDYLVKDEVNSPILLRSVRYAIERKKTERTVRQQAEELRILNQLTRHDIRNEMTLVVGRAQELEEYVDHHGAPALEEIVRTSNHVLQLTRTVGDIVDSITVDDADLDAVNLRSILVSEVATAHKLYGDVDISHEDVPEVEVEANELLTSVFGNLLSNAVLYNDKDVPTVTVDVDVDDDVATVRIADNGPGISDRRKERVFGEGEQGTESSGTGIGLYLVKQLVDQYGGRVWIEDNEPTGSVFCVELNRA